MSDSNNDYVFDLLTIGETAVGKTAIIQRFENKEFKKNHFSTIGIDFKSKVITVDDKTVNLRIWDTCGQEQFHNIMPAYYKKSDGILVVYDVTKRKSFSKIAGWMENIHKNVDIKETAIVLLGNKIDEEEEEREVTTEEGIELAKELKVRFFETSAYENINISESFQYLASKLIQMRNGSSNDTSYLVNNPKNKNIQLHKRKKKQKNDTKCDC